MKKKRPVIIGIGEVLWDLLPGGKQLSGAPFNFIHHVKQLGAEDTYIVSAVGNDGFGKDLLNRITSIRLDTSYIQVIGKYRTGTLSVTLDAEGNPSYLIDGQVAWDHIAWNKELKDLASRADIICFGTLAQRSQRTKETIYKFLNAAKASCIKIFDVNIRQQFYSAESIIQSLKLANVLKLNKSGMIQLAGVLSIKGAEDEIMSELLKRYNLQLIALTKGSEGSVLLNSSGKSVLKAPKVGVLDTNGAGDAFTAVLAIDYFNKENLLDIHRHASKISAFVCTHEGATPSLPAFLK